MAANILFKNEPGFNAEEIIDGANESIIADCSITELCFIASNADEIDKCIALYDKLPKKKSEPNQKPVIIIDGNLTYEDKQGFIGKHKGQASFIFAEFEIKAGEEVVENYFNIILKQVTIAREIGIAHNRKLDVGIFRSEEVSQFEFAEDDPKKYFKHFLEFAAYGGNDEEANKYWEELKKKFGLEDDNIEAIENKFGLDAGKYKDLFKDGSINIDNAQKFLKGEYDITEKNTIYNAKITCNGRLVENKNGYDLYIVSEHLSEFKGSGVKTVFHFSQEDIEELREGNVIIDDISRDNIGQVAAINPRLAAAMGETIHQMNEKVIKNKGEGKSPFDNLDEPPVFNHSSREKVGRPSESPGSPLWDCRKSNSINI
ncbi:hypothetical protein N9X24_00580 [Rickettsiales bacterium]|nr:hypothetical protein [Rickettsiales bacterium]